MNRLPRKYVPLAATAVLLLMLFGSASFAYENFCSSFVIADLFSENAFLGITAIGMTLVILSGGIDLSVGSVIGFTTIFVASLIADYQIHPVVAWILALLLGTAFGLVMGILIQQFRLPAFLVTLGGLFFARGMAFVVKNESVQINHTFYKAIKKIVLPIGGGAELSLAALLFLGLLSAMIIVLHYTRFGRNVYALGGNEESALLMGLPVAKTKIAVYTLNGFCSALAGIALTLFTGSGDPTKAMALELDAIAVVVIGGTLLTGGVGYVAGTLLGVLVYGTIYQVKLFAGLPSSLASLAIGSLLLAFILLQKVVGVRSRA